MKYEKYKKIGISCVMAMVMTMLIVMRMGAEAQAYLLETQEALAQEVLRFHVLANSDSEEDQALKMQVKEQIISYMEKELGAESDLTQTKVWVENHGEDIKKLSENVVNDAGYTYEVKVELTESYFPNKTYGDVTFPQGVYEALKIEIGDAAGANWWCCLYPNLCFIDATISVVSEEGKEELQEVLTEDEYKLITTTSERKISWFFFDR